MSTDYNVRINDPAIAAAWAAACKENDDAEAAMIAELRAWGVKGARPDDGHVNRVQNYFGMAYPWYNDGVAAGDLFALGWPGKLRLVRIDCWADAGGLLSGYKRFWFTPEGCATCLCMVTTAMRPWPTMGDTPHALCASCTADVDRSRTVPPARPKMSLRATMAKGMNGFARGIMKWPDTQLLYLTGDSKAEREWPIWEFTLLHRLLFRLRLGKPFGSVVLFGLGAEWRNTHLDGVAPTRVRVGKWCITPLIWQA